MSLRDNFIDKNEEELLMFYRNFFIIIYDMDDDNPPSTKEGLIDQILNLYQVQSDMKSK